MKLNALVYGTAHSANDASARASRRSARPLSCNAQTVGRSRDTLERTEPQRGAHGVAAVPPHGRRQPIARPSYAARRRARRAPLNRLSTVKLQELTKALPKIDLHRHLEGSIRPEDYVMLARSHNLPIAAETVESLRPSMQVSSNCASLLEFLAKFDVVRKMFVTPAVARDATYSVIMEAAADNIKYLEIRFSPSFMSSAHHLDPDEILRAVIDGAASATRDGGPKVNLIVAAERQEGPARARAMLKLAAKYRDAGVVAVDLVNDEEHFPPGPYADVFQEARSNGLEVTIHAGEAGGADNVQIAVENLTACRIGHGTRSVEDSRVVQMLVDRGIFLEMCPTSNVQTGTVECLGQHPLRQLMEAGVRVTINTDDPAVSGIDQSHELLASLQQFGLSMEDLERLTLTAVDAAFLASGQRHRLRREMKASFAVVREQFLDSLTPAEFDRLASTT